MCFDLFKILHAMFTLSPAYETFIHGRRERDVKLLMQTTQDYDG